MSSPNFSAVVLCAGKGTRMNSARAKVLHPILGRPLCWYPIARAFELGASNVAVVVGHQSDDVKAELSKAFAGKVSFSLQAQQRGTGDAVAAAREALKGVSGGVMILYGDVPLLKRETLQTLLDAWASSKATLAMLSLTLEDPTGYGRLIRESGKVTRIVEHKDANPEQRAVREVNAGIYVVDAAFLWGALEKLSPRNAQGELYLTDIVEQAARSSTIVVVPADAEETAGVNDKLELAAREKVLQQRINAQHMKAGVTLILPETIRIEEGAVIGQDCVLEPMTFVSAGSRLGSGVRLGQGSHVTRSQLDDGVEVKPYSVFEDARVGKASIIGPFARLRPGTELSEGVHIGNFVETKKARIGKGSKANHLAYLGDAEIGSGTNIGAGTITCNYDGVNKHVTTLGDGVFVGSDTQLVAPVKVGDGTFIAAGTTVTEDVPAGSLVLSRAPLVIKEGWAERRKKVLGALK